jgi:hypothetical protein
LLGIASAVLLSLTPAGLVGITFLSFIDREEEREKERKKERRECLGLLVRGNTLGSGVKEIISSV